MVADGYKKTEIGVIPVEWEVVKLQDYVKLTSGKFNPKKNLQEEKNDNFKYPVYGGNGITGFFTDYLVSNSTIIIGRVGEYCGSVHLERNSMWITDNAIYTKEINSKFNIDFLYETFGLIGLENLAERTGQPKITQEPIYNLKIPLPPLKEQEKIADILSTADEKIDAIEGQIQKAETLKKGLLQKLLSEGIGHSDFKDSELGKIPESWEVVELGSCVNGKGNYGIGAVAVNYDENLPTYLRITDIDDNGNFISSNKKCVDSPDASNYQLEDGDIVFARTGNTTGKTYLYNTDDGVLIYAGFLIKFTPNKEVLNTYYLKLQASTERYWNWVKVTSMRTGQPGINSEEYGNFLLPLPPLKEQKQIAEILSTADEKLEVLRAKKEKYETLKKGLLQKLLSGEVRV